MSDTPISLYKLAIQVVPDEQNLRSVRWDTKLVHRLEQLEGACSDLSDAANFLDRMKLADDYITLDALATAAVVRYARCFKSGVRNSLHSLIGWPENMSSRELHDRVLAIRDRHVSHAVNEFETNSAMLWIRDDESGHITSVSTATRTAIAISYAEALELTALCGAWHSAARDAIWLEQNELIKSARELPVDVVLRMPSGSKETSPDPLRRRQ